MKNKRRLSAEQLLRKIRRDLDEAWRIIEGAKLQLAQNARKRPARLGRPQVIHTQPRHVGEDDTLQCILYI